MRPSMSSCAVMPSPKNALTCCATLFNPGKTAVSELLRGREVANQLSKPHTLEAAEMSDGLVFNETLYPGVQVSYSCSEILYQEKTEHQDLVLFSNPVFGRILMLDGVTQVTTADEFIYHEMMSHVPIIAHGAARNVLIVGGGDCGLAEEVLKHATVEKLVQVEIDASVVEFSKEHFEDFNKGVLDDPRFELVIADENEIRCRNRPTLRCGDCRQHRSARAGCRPLFPKSSTVMCIGC